MTRSWQARGDEKVAATPSHIWASVEPEALRALSQVQEVDNIFVEQEGHVCSVTIVIPRRDATVLEKIFALELEVMDRAPDLEFDFTVISRDGRPLSELVTPAGGLMFSKA